ncbi:MAG: hypothetical protein WAW39_21975 [Prosthecobacter sp.]|uniref:hypothetical protein n=1 Tax=Prosthecobacter sp. TaxID=1965333 RepID=UPI003BAE80C4
MKSLLIHFAKDHGNGRLELAGRCSEDPIWVGDEFTIEGNEETRLRVLTIEVYGRQVHCLERGYVGNLFVQQADPVAPFMRLTGCQSSSENV